MMVEDLQGNIIGWNPQKNRPRLKCSELHLKIRNYLTEKYPTFVIMEEVPIKVYPKKVLFLDFYVPVLRMAIEAQGKQHDEYCKHFHGNRMNFFTQKKNDRLKKEWCEINGITHLEINDKDKLENII